MHSSCLGVLPYLLGCVLYELFKEMYGVLSRPESTLTDIMHMIRTAAKAIGHDRPPINTLTMLMIRGKASRGPKLKVKAAEARNLLFCMRFILKTLLPPTTPHQIMRLNVVSEICSMYETLYAWDANPTCAIIGEHVASHGRKALLLYAELSHQTLVGSSQMQLFLYPIWFC